MTVYACLDFITIPPVIFVLSVPITVLIAQMGPPALSVLQERIGPWLAVIVLVWLDIMMMGFRWFVICVLSCAFNAQTIVFALSAMRQLM